MFMDVASYYINTAAHGGHDILCHLCEFGSIKSGNVPSWIPDWSTRRHPESYIAYDSTEQQTLRACTRKITDLSQYFCDHISPPNRLRFFEAQEWLTKRNFFSTKLVPFGQRLRVDCHPLAFVDHGGIADRVICHSAAPSFWGEVIAAAELEIIHHESNKTDRPDEHSLLTFLARNHVDFGSFDFELTLHLHIDELCKALLAFRDQRLNDDHKIILEQISSSLHHWVIVRIQAMNGPYWAYGPPDSLVGDWVVPLLLAQRNAVLPMMCLRPTRPAKTEPLLRHPLPHDPLGDGVGERYLRFFSREKATEIGCLHVTATFVGLAIHYDSQDASLYHSLESPSRKVEMMNIMYCATAAARVKGLLGPIVFDII